MTLSKSCENRAKRKGGLYIESTCRILLGLEEVSVKLIEKNKLMLQANRYQFSKNFEDLVYAGKNLEAEINNVNFPSKSQNGKGSVHSSDDIQDLKASNAQLEKHLNIFQTELTYKSIQYEHLMEAHDELTSEYNEQTMQLKQINQHTDDLKKKLHEERFHTKLSGHPQDRDYQPQYVLKNAQKKNLWVLPSTLPSQINF
ncbi:hypothetical protein K501DRAFT_271933 [Backusella circina FSU 941]|nr:hypothetical protein K501DRAFT_271933 [Backusella circina FSU 941]